MIVLSPAKTLDFASPLPTRRFSQPALLGTAAELVELLRGYDADGLRRLMGISEDLARLNVERFANWRPPFGVRNARPAVFAFAGEVYAGLAPRTLGAAEISWLQTHVRILSGLYGVLRPLDLMQAYRLEMGTRLPTPRGVGLYRFWGTRIADVLAEALPGRRHRILVDLASDEYARAVDVRALGVRVVQPVFQERRGTVCKVISFSAKRARGAMTRWAARQGVSDPADLRAFDEDGYRFSAQVSTADRWVFRR